MDPTQCKFKYDIRTFPFFCTTYDHSMYDKHFKNVMTRKFFRYLRNQNTIPKETTIFDRTTGVTFGEMSLYIIHIKNLKRTVRYEKHKKNKI